LFFAGHRQAERYAREGVPISLSTLADSDRGCTAALILCSGAFEANVLAGGGIPNGINRKLYNNFNYI
jgi:hypothetical protein